MTMRHRLTVGLVTGLGVVCILTTSSVVYLANHFVELLSQPHTRLDEKLFHFTLPPVTTEPPQTLQRPIIFRTTDGLVLRGDFWAQPHPAPPVIIRHALPVPPYV